MTRAQSLIEKFDTAYAPLGEADDAPVLTAAGDAAIKRVDTFAKDQLRGLNPALKWAWAGRQPSAPQRMSDNLEWSLSVNSQSHGDALVTETAQWARETLTPATEDAFGGGELRVTVDVDEQTFDKDADDERAGITFVNVTLRLHDLMQTGLVAPASAGE